MLTSCRNSSSKSQIRLTARPPNGLLCLSRPDASTSSNAILLCVCLGEWLKCILYRFFVSVLVARPGARRVFPSIAPDQNAIHGERTNPNNNSRSLQPYIYGVCAPFNRTRVGFAQHSCVGAIRGRGRVTGRRYALHIRAHTHTHEYMYA